MSASPCFQPQLRYSAQPWSCVLLMLVLRLATSGVLAWTERLDHGSVKGFPSYAEANTLLSEWLSAHSTILRKQQIGSSFENRPIEAFVLVHPDAPAGKAQMLLTSLMHAREPAGLTVLLYFLGHLLELYDAGDPEAVYIIRTRELWLVPFVNPDGYIANEKSKTKMIRKNRRPTCKNLANSGVDINRNFGYHWRAEFAKCNEEYQGTAAFSEPETQALKKVCDDNNFKAAMNYHSFGGMLTHPFNFGKQALPKDDAKIYNEIAKVFKWEKFGTALETVGYTAPGESDDWFYGSKHIMSMSPEVGPESGDFWPNSKLAGGIDSRNFERTKAVVLKAGLEPVLSLRHMQIANAPLWSSLTPTPLAFLELSLGNSGLSESAGDLIVLMAGVARPGAASQAGDTGAILALNGDSVHQNVLLSGSVAPIVVLRVPPVPRRSSLKFRLAVAGGLEAEGSRELRVCVREAQAEVAPGGVAICFCGTASLPAVSAKAATAEVMGGSFVLASSSTGSEHFTGLCAASLGSGAATLAPAPALSTTHVHDTHVPTEPVSAAVAATSPAEEAHVPRGQAGTQATPAPGSTDLTGLSASDQPRLRAPGEGSGVVLLFASVASVTVLCIVGQAVRTRRGSGAAAPDVERVPALQVPAELDEGDSLEQSVELEEKTRLAGSV